MCKFCNARDNDDGKNNADNPIFDRFINVGFFGDVRVWGMIEFIDNEDILCIGIQSDNGVVVDNKSIKYCPMCGRKLEAADAKKEQENSEK